ncbi:MAG: hypothetical protein JWN64_250 [Parcubacteria group bacterium]|nr:hypothetical protein [Parcubacteria group bacterium]
MKQQYQVWIVVVLVLAGLVWGFWFLRTPQADREADIPSAAIPMPTEQSNIYTNGEYGFSLVYPQGAKVENTFTAFYHLPPTWRANPVSIDATGTPIAAVIGYQTASEDSYPRYFVAMVRIGASKDPGEVASCEKVTPDRGETALPDVTLNGTVFKAFSFQEAAMMQYSRGVSYRAVHEGACVAVEKIQTGSNYMDDPDSVKDVPDEKLQAEYAKLDTIVQSFRFARP